MLTEGKTDAIEEGADEERLERLSRTLVDEYAWRAMPAMFRAWSTRMAPSRFCVPT
jgi:hypothetical protein